MKAKFTVFSDYHHAGLYHALDFLFVKRLGGLLLRPIGMEWARRGIWSYSTDENIQRQFLDEAQGDDLGEGLFRIKSEGEELDTYGITYDTFKKIKIDYVLATCTGNELGFYFVKNAYQKEAKFLRLVGNSGEYIGDYVKNLIDTTGLYNDLKIKLNYILIHQEFDTKLFDLPPPKKTNVIRTFINCFPSNPFYWLWEELKSKLPDFEFYMHGHHGENGFITPISKLAEAMNETTFVFHPKLAGEGYGHIIHNAICAGRAVITLKKLYQGKIAEPLLEDGKTAILADGKTIEQIVEEIRTLATPKKLEEISKFCKQRFRREVNFEEEEKNFIEFLERAQ
jgi:hypothetical protein